MLCVIYRDGTVCQWSRSSHTGLCDPQWSSSQYARSDGFPYYRDNSLHGFFSSPLKSVLALLCPCRVDAVILSALNLARLCCDRGSFLNFTSTHCEKMECLEFSAGDCVDFMNPKIFKKCPPANYHPEHKKRVPQRNLSVSYRL